MSFKDDILTVLDARIVADGLKEGDIEGLCELDKLLKATCGSGKVAGFMLQLVFELLPDRARELLEARAAETTASNVIDLFTRKPHDEAE